MSITILLLHPFNSHLYDLSILIFVFECIYSHAVHVWLYIANIVCMKGTDMQALGIYVAI